MRASADLQAQAVQGGGVQSRSRGSQGYTSIIYFHGMGTPRRYEELSRVLDTLDRYAETQDPAKIGMLRGQAVGLEPCRDGGEEPIAFLRFSRFLRQGDSETVGAGLYRLYESYWSPAAAGGASPLAVLGWVLTRILTPLSVLTQPWRAHQRLKNTFLNRLFYDRGKTPALGFQRLGAAYRAFEGMGARRTFPRGRFKDFEEHLSAEYEDPGERAGLLALARRWRQSLWRAQGEAVLVGSATLAVLAGAVSMVAYIAAVWARETGVAIPLVERLVASGGQLQPLLVIFAAAVLVFGAWRLAHFLRLFLSDVVFWTTTLEKDVRYQKRREILNAAESTVRHVLADAHCERIVILAHSLGTAIAYETLLRLGRKLDAERNAGATGPDGLAALRKISHFITMGSPIDRISYFFQLRFSPYHRFNRVFDTMLGSAADPPFKDGRVSGVQWINIRDRADPIASRLFSPRGPLPNRDTIHEVEIASSHFPDPAGAHTGYFNATLSAKVLFDACVLGRRSIQLQSDRPEWSRRWAQGVGVAARILIAFLIVALGCGALAYWMEQRAVLAFCQGMFVWCAGALLAARGVGALLDRRFSLVLPP